MISLPDGIPLNTTEICSVVKQYVIVQSYLNSWTPHKILHLN